MLPHPQAENTPYLNKNSEVEIHHTRDLPHWNQPGKLQYVTFRLADSLPQTKLAELKQLRDNFEAANPKPWSEETTRRYYKLLGPVENRLLDNGYGSCILKIKEIRDILSSSIMYFDHVKYEVMAYVIMPNHVHMVILLLNDSKLAACMHSIKSYSAKKINNQLGRDGKIWLKENFDRIIRSYDHFRHCLNYIIENPRNLKEGEYELYVNREFNWTVK